MCSHGPQSLSCVSPDVGSFYFSPYLVILFFVIPNHLGCHSSKITFVRKNSCSKGKDFTRVKILWLVMVARRIPTRRIRQARFLSALVETFFILDSSRNLQWKSFLTIQVVCLRLLLAAVMGWSVLFPCHGIANGGSRGTSLSFFDFPPGDAILVLPLIPHVRTLQIPRKIEGEVLAYDAEVSTQSVACLASLCCLCFSPSLSLLLRLLLRVGSQSRVVQ